MRTGGSAEAVPAEPVGGVQDAAAAGDMSGEGAGCCTSASATRDEEGAKVKSKVKCTRHCRECIHFFHAPAVRPVAMRPREDVVGWGTDGIHTL